MSRFVEICGDYIDLNEVRMVTAISKSGSGANWQNYKVWFKGSNEFHVYYQYRTAEDNYFPREKFIELLDGKKKGRK